MLYTQVLYIFRCVCIIMSFSCYIFPYLWNILRLEKLNKFFVPVNVVKYNVAIIAVHFLKYILFLICIQRAILNIIIRVSEMGQFR